jgi:hypothetical protein
VNDSNVYVLIEPLLDADAPTMFEVGRFFAFVGQVLLLGTGGGFAADAVPISTAVAATAASATAPKRLPFIPSFPLLNCSHRIPPAGRIGITG